MNTSVDYIIIFPLLLFAVIVHEISHGWVAYLNGDDTAKISGRLTLNPIPHIDPVWTILMPLLLVFMHSPIILGGAKPVPVNPYRLNNPVPDMAKIGAAGPGSNFIMAILSALIIWLFKLTGASMYSSVNLAIVKILYINVQINLVLAVFNLVPIPPLDGSRILSALLPSEVAYRYNQLERYGIFIIFGLLYFGFLNFIWSVVIFLNRLLFMGV